MYGNTKNIPVIIYMISIILYQNLRDIFQFSCTHNIYIYFFLMEFHVFFSIGYETYSNINNVIPFFIKKNKKEIVIKVMNFMKKLHPS